MTLSPANADTLQLAAKYEDLWFPDVGVCTAGEKPSGVSRGDRLTRTVAPFRTPIGAFSHQNDLLKARQIGAILKKGVEQANNWKPQLTGLVKLRLEPFDQIELVQGWSNYSLSKPGSKWIKKFWWAPDPVQN